MKNNKGITLASLVLTIIVLLILASIFVYSGVNTVRYTKFNKAKSEISVVQTNVNSWYQELKNVENTDEYKALQTDDEKKQYKNNFLNDKGYGVTTDDPACNQKKLDDTLQGLNDKGIEIENFDNYRFLSSTFLENKLGLNASYDYLANIEDRTVILFGGIQYNGEWYYTMEDFGLTNIKSNTISGITFDLAQGDQKEIVISNLKMTDNENNKIDFSKFIVEYKKKGEANWTDVTKDIIKFEDGEGNNKTNKFKFKLAEYGEYDVKVKTIDKKYEGFNDFNLKARAGISVGDYITYKSPVAKTETPSVSLSTTETGYPSEQILPAKDTFRVMDIDEDGNMTLMGAMTSSDKIIYFGGAQGYNNAVYTLNIKCSELYKDESKGITARSIKVEDITSKFNDNGNRKITTYIDGQVGTETADGSLKTGKYIKNIDKKNKKITYQTKTNYPDIFQYETGGIIDNIATTGVIGQSESYSEYNYNGYKGLTNLSIKTPKPTNLTVTFTYYKSSHTEEDDFYNEKGYAAAYQDMLFATKANFWLASRCIHCDSYDAVFDLRYVSFSNLDAAYLFFSGDSYNNIYHCVCPVVYIPSSVEIEVSSNPKNQTNTSGTAHVVK